MSSSGRRVRRGKDLSVYLFESGKRDRTSPTGFDTHQLRKGIDFILEEISRHNSNKDVKGLYTMDGKEIAHLEDLKEAGAYVIVYKDQHFDNATTYDIPDGAKDTSYEYNIDDDPPRGRLRKRGDSNLSSSSRQRRGGRRGKDLFVYLFQNGKGYRASPKVFFPHQLVKGIDFILEEISRHNSNKDVKGLYTMDGKEIVHLEDLKEAGAYVIVYNGQHFDDSATYYIPDGAKDTSYQSNSDDDSPRGR